MVIVSHNFKAFLSLLWLSHPTILKFYLPGPNLDRLCARHSDANLFFRNYAELCFEVKHLEKVLNRGGEIFGTLFFKKVPFLHNIERCPKFLD